MRVMSRILAAAIAVTLLVFSGAAFADDDDDDEDNSGSEPAVVVLGVVDVGSNGGLFQGEVDSEGRTTSYVFEYGTTTAYGAQTPSASAGALDAWRTVSTRVDGLQPGTKYHYRLVARNALGTMASADRTFTTLGAAAGDPRPAQEGTPAEGEETPAPADEDAVEPQLATSVAVEPRRGEVRVRRPGGSDFVPLTAGSELPVGSEVDARDGRVRLTAALPTGETQTGRFGGGRFVIRQGSRGLVHLYLRGPICSRREAAGSAVAFTARRRRAGRRLWGRDKGGRFRTHGKNSHATVRGTRWVVRDRCDGTLTRVTEGSVVVRDKVRRKRVIVRVGERYLAPPRR
jgi:hypothetical protein